MTMTDDNHAHDLVIERTFDAPPWVIWKMWAEPEHFAAWYGPTGASISVAVMDVRVGGTRLLRMEVTTPDGTMQMWFAGQYLEVIENQHLVYTDAMSDEYGNVLSPEQTGMPTGHPTTTEVRVELEPVLGGTKVRLAHIGIPAESPGAAGWAMALDKLTSHLSERSIQ
jgi:uncharacterized protein YndB with AHSA1/START domain